MTRLFGIVALLLASIGPAAAGEALFSAEGYRIAAYLAATTEDVPGARTVTTEEVERLVASGGAVLIDVLPAPPRPEGLSESTIWAPPPHYAIPGSAWLPNVGYGVISGAMEAYFGMSLERLTAGHLARPVVIYCKPECWMSWNAAKRAVAYGYRQVLWYPDGAQGWSDAGLELAAVEPEPMDPR